MTRTSLFGIAVAAGLLTWLLPVPEALGAVRSTTAAFAAVTTGAVVAIAGAGARTWATRARRRRWLIVAAAGVVLGALAFLAAARAEQACTARHDGRAVLIGHQLTPLGESYRKANPDLSVDDLVFDAAGNTEQVWTRASIDRCRLVVSGTYFLWWPLLAVSLLAAVQGLSPGLLTAPPTPALAPAPAGPPDKGEPAAAPRYDVFLSYRHGGRDGQVATNLVEALETEGYVVAIDVRDFPANAHFLEEMERCIRQSRFTVAVLSERYLESGHCQEEALICKVLDMGQRQRRLIPLYIDAVAVPIWLHGIVGIRLDAEGGPVDPLDALVSTLGRPMARRATPGAAPDADPPVASPPSTASPGRARRRPERPLDDSGPVH